jgi:hypothetical protein
MRKHGSLFAAAVVIALLAIPVATMAANKTHDMAVQVVSVDMKAKKITVKDEKGEDHTAPLLGAAVGEAKGLKPGDKVTVSCEDNEKGDHLGVKAIKKG